MPTHAYAVLQVRAACGVQLLQLKNPWARKRWRGAFSVFDRQRWTPELRKAFGFDQQASLQQDNGIFWIDYDSLLRHFEGVFLNWNPQLFKHHTVTHGQWPPRAAFRDDAVDLGTNPQYQLTVNVPPAGAATAVWVLLTRHSSRPYNLAMAEGRDASRDAFLTVHVFRGGARAHYLERCWMQGVYSNRPLAPCPARLADGHVRDVSRTCPTGRTRSSSSTCPPRPRRSSSPSPSPSTSRPTRRPAARRE